MLIDHAKGVEARTLKLFEVCRMRNLPIVTFMNKLDRDGLDPLQLIDEVSETLNLRVCPMNWRSVWDEASKVLSTAETKMVSLYTPEAWHPNTQRGLKTLEEVSGSLGDDAIDKVEEELELLEIAGDPFTEEDFLAGKASPVFWGSAVTNFGSTPTSKLYGGQFSSSGGAETEEGVTIEPDNNQFSGIVFKIQANMNPKHRDRIAFLRV